MPKSTKVKRRKQAALVREYIDVFDEGWDAKDHDTIHGIYGSPEHNLGVVRVIQAGLPSFERNLAIARDSNIYGLPLNKIFELYGKEQSGKTSLLLYWCVMIIKAGGVAYFVDFEHKYDPVWLLKIAAANGVSKELLEKKFKYVDPKHFEGFINWLVRFEKKIIVAKNDSRRAIIELDKNKKRPVDYDGLIAHHKKIIDTPFFVGVDSIASMYTRKEIEGKKNQAEAKYDVTDTEVASLARLFAIVLSRVRYYLGYTGCLIVFTNQIRDNIETNQFLAKKVSKIKTKGGHAVKHFSDGRIQISRIGRIKKTRKQIEYIIGSYHKLKVEKNQMGPPPFRETELTFLNDSGFFSFQSILDALVTVGRIRHEGSYYILSDKTKIHQADLSDYLVENPRIYNIVSKAYLKFMEAE